MRQLTTFICVIIINFFYPVLNLWTQLDCPNGFPNIDNSRPVRLIIYYDEAEVGTEPNKIQASYIQIRDKIIENVGALNESVFNSKAENDNDPQRFEIARICRLPNNYSTETIKYHQQYVYISDIFVDVSPQYESSGIDCPTCHYNSCPPLNETQWVNVQWSRLSGNHYQLAHEVGHVCGCDHNTYSLQQCEWNWMNYNHGWRSDENPIYIATIMAYDNDTIGRIKYFSNPDITLTINNINYVIGESGKNNARVIRELKNVTKNICTSIDNININTIDLNWNTDEINEGEMADVFAIHTIVAGESYKINSDAVAQFRAGDRIHIRSGFHAKSGCKFKAFINDGTSRGYYGN